MFYAKIKHVHKIDNLVINYLIRNYFDIKKIFSSMEGFMKDNNGIVINKKHIVTGAIIILLMIIGALMLGLNWNKWFGEGTPNNPATSQKNDLDIDPDASDWNGEQIPDKGGEEVGIKIPGYPSITLPANKKDVTVALLNPEGNPCYFVFEIVLKDSGKSLYKSKLVPPGKAITKISLSQALSSGEYDATIKITTYSTANQSPMNGANVETVLIVK